MSNIKTSVGRSLVKKRFPNQRRATSGDEWVHQRPDFTASTDWNRLNLRSVTDQNSLDEFLTTAQLAGTDFAAERLNVTFVPAVAKVGILSADDKERIRQVQNLHRDSLRIPRRPAWTPDMSAEQIDQQERTSFLDWRRKLALLQQIDDLTLTPFEKNLEFWRQLWRVIEKSDIIVQIVDARNPLLFRCDDLETYVRELSPDHKKVNVILVNKADLLTDEQRQAWATFFDEHDMRVIFYSALQSAPSTKKTKTPATEKHESESIDDTEKILEDLKRNQSNYNDDNFEVSKSPSKLNRFDGLQEEDENDEKQQQSDIKMNNEDIFPNDDEEDDEQEEDEHVSDEEGEEEENDEDLVEQIRDDIYEYENSKETKKKNLSIIVNREELIYLLKCLYVDKATVRDDILTIGMVGYPNVGKSSTINSLLQYKKVSVSSTPGKTKHFQTIFLEKHLLLCDCPGLVFPSFVSTKDELIVNGILPIDQMRDYIGPVNLIPRTVLSHVYNILLPLPKEGEDVDRPPTSVEFCATYAYRRGFMTHKGIPDGSRAARLILKDYVSGKLLYCYPPPGYDSDEFQQYSVHYDLGPDDSDDTNIENTDEENKSNETTSKQSRFQPSDVDRQFFNPTDIRVGSKGIHGRLNYTRRNGPMLVGETINDSTNPSPDGKPWKKHNNRNKKEKLRRIYRHLDA